VKVDRDKVGGIAVGVAGLGWGVDTLEGNADVDIDIDAEEGAKDGDDDDDDDE